MVHYRQDFGTIGEKIQSVLSLSSIGLNVARVVFSVVPLFVLNKDMEDICADLCLGRVMDVRSSILRH
jgi:hypothetical protein